MSEAFVADCSVGIGWVHPAQTTELTRRLLEDAKNGASVHTRVQLICPDFDLRPHFIGVLGGTPCYRHGTQTGIFESF